MSEISVAVADDIPLMRQALTTYVQQEPRFTLAGEAANGAEAIDLVRQVDPDVLLLDLQMPVMDGVTAAERIIAENPHTKILAITTFYSDDYVIPALKAGVHGYLLKDARPQEITDAILAVTRGQSVISQRAIETITASLAEPEQVATVDQDLWDSLTGTEKKVLKALYDGLSNRAIARELYLAESTVKSTISRIMQKMGVSSRLQIVIKAAKLSFPLDA
ncbi:response regulator transcription factor [Rothia sp. LK2588]|uniref:response regulator n=1 Tax=Rothia sp. LK2588 TaxID=3114369 RepID=UPI0034CEE5BE